jgi:hypothetical protein
MKHHFMVNDVSVFKRILGGQRNMTRNLVRGLLGLVLAAGATWLANMIVERIFGPEDYA